MDIFSHGLYGGVAFGHRSKRDYIIAFLFGIGPDFLSFGLFFILMFLGLESFSNGNYFDPPQANAIPHFVYALYNITHSLVIYGIFFALLWFSGKKRFAKLTLGWPLHILVDIPTHVTTFFPTPFLWPISNFSVSGIPWGRPIIFIPNVIVLVSLYSYWYFKNKKNSISAPRE